MVLIGIPYSKNDKVEEYSFRYLDYRLAGPPSFSVQPWVESLRYILWTNSKSSHRFLVRTPGFNKDFEFLLFCMFSFSMAKMAIRRIRHFHPCSFAMFAFFLSYVAHVFTTSTDAHIFTMAITEHTNSFVCVAHHALFLKSDGPAYRSAFVCVR